MSLSSQVNSLATAIANYFRDSVLPRLLPSGGSTGQVLTKTSGTAYAASWQDASGGGVSSTHPTITTLLSTAAQARNNNPRTRGQMVDPPTVVATASQPAALTRTYSIGSGSLFVTSGGTPSTAGGFTSFPSTTFTVGQLPFVWRVEAVVDADTVSFQLDSAASDGYRFIVDGEYVSETGSNYNSGSPGWYTLQFASRAMRSIIVEGREALRFGAVAVAPTAKCLLPVGQRLRAYFVGDSNAYVYGLAQKCNSYAAVLADCLGVADITINAISGSGFSVNGGFKSYGEREADWNGLAEPLDLLIFQMSVNDIIADVPAATIKASVAARLSAARAAHPGALIVVIGVVTWDEWGTTFAEHETAAAEAVAEASDAGMLFVPVRNASEEEILTGSALAFDGTASFYVDDSAGHLGYAGNTYVGRWLADRLVDAMAAHAGIDAPQALPPPPAVDADVFATPVVEYASGTQRDVAAGASSTFSLPGTVAAGNACIVAIAQWQDGDAITAVTVGGVAAIRDVRSINPINTNFRAEIWRTPNATAEHSRTVVITYESGVESVWIDCGLIEVSGLHDAPLSTAGTSSGTADAISTSAINVSLPRSLVVSATASVSSSTTHTYTELSGQTQIWEEPDSVNWMAGVGGYSVSGVGVAQHAWSVSPTTDRWASAAAAYRPALAATASSAPAPSSYTQIDVIESTPTPPAADTVRIFARSVGGRMLPAAMGPSGLDTVFQPHLGRNAVCWARPVGNGTVLGVMGIAITATGTATGANVATTNRHTRMKRLDYLVTTAAATAVAGFRSTGGQFTVGAGAAEDGGFHFVCRFGPATGATLSTRRAFVGMGSTAAPTDVEPSTITNSVGVGHDAADTNYQIMHRGAGAITKIDTGIPKVCSADRTEVYELALFSPPGTTQQVSYEFTRLSTGDRVTGVITTNLPTGTTLLAPRGWTSVGGTSSVIGIALMGLAIETDY